MGQIDAEIKSFNQLKCFELAAEFNEFKYVKKFDDLAWLKFGPGSERHGAEQIDEFK